MSVRISSKKNEDAEPEAPTPPFPLGPREKASFPSRVHRTPHLKKVENVL